MQYDRLSTQLRADRLSVFVLPCLLSAMRTVRPLLQHNDMKSLLSQLDDDHFKEGATSEFKSLETVQSNINDVRLWFNAAEVIPMFGVSLHFPVSSHL